ncbi:hypothetical protein P167DRAFT_564665 [Morchella conica CCBAS932]|uniref:U3 small nucleolar RNA-associated protein 10 n=1 Tax=Morchella conica CCBAS932 TaxID=1392247 RepID=A0A3N4KUQ6_9PEZI|nr:hypothetical protein P167DRAFT_564665 [Morchella conica CCBAS932]
MASSLAAQLQRITATSTNTLNTQKLKQLHSASLLFPEAHAATQDLDTIFSIAAEGFRELCQLDERFVAHERGLFSESSKGVDRFLLPRNEVDELDKSIEAFLQLVSGKLLLRPSLKAVEWLVRRFRVQEQNTAAILLCFLPYHAHPTLLPTLLGIIPAKSLPREFGFLAPYLSPASPVPRHVVTHALSHRRDFFTLLSAHVTTATRTRRDSHALHSFFSTVATESVSLMCDATRKAGAMSEQDVLHLAMPILEEAYQARKAPEFQIGAYMLTTVVVAKLSLSGQLLLALMQSIVKGWSKDTVSAGLACLAFLAQARQGEKEVRVSDEVVKGLVKIEDIAERLLAMGEKYRVDKLVVGLCLGALDKVGRKYGLRELTIVVKLLEEARMGPKQRRLVMKKLVDSAQKVGEGRTAVETEEGSNALEDVKEKLASSLVRWTGLGEKKKMGKLVKEILETESVDIELLELRLQTVIRPAIMPAAEPKALKAIEAPPAQAETFEELLAAIPAAVEGDSFLAPTTPGVLERLGQAFITAITTSQSFAPALQLPIFKSKPVDHAFALSFLVKIWTSLRYPALARTTALHECTSYIKIIGERVDFQALFPHILVALADPSINVRREAATLARVLNERYVALGGELGKKKKRRKSEAAAEGPIKYWALDSIYGTGKETEEVKWLETAEARKFIEAVIMSNLEECVLDSHVIGRSVENVLGTATESNVKSSLKTSMMSFLSSHTVNMPALLPKLRLLTMLNRVEKAPTSRTEFLAPVLESWVDVLDYQTRVAQCAEERVDIVSLEEQLVSVVSEGGDAEGAAVLVHIIEKGFSPTLRIAAAARITKIWNTLDDETKTGAAEKLLEITLSGEDVGEAHQVLRDVTISTEVFSRFLDESRAELKSALPGSAVANNKRQKMTAVVTAGADNEVDQAVALRRVTVVAELIEGQSPEKHAELLKQLFGVLADVGSVEYAGIAYLHGVLLSCMSAIIRSFKGTKSINLDSTVRADVLVNCIRSTSSPQVQNSALLLLASLADVAPDVVKHSVMPIFTFMGANTLRQDDEYSAHVIEQTIKRVIPPLVKSLQEQGGNPVVGTAELISTFVASYKHIPVHRRVRLFIALAETLGVDEFLFTLLAKLAEKYRVNVGGQVKTDDGNISEFCTMLAGSFSAETQLLNVVKYLDVILDVVEPSGNGLAKHIFEESNETPIDLAGRLLQVLAAVLKNDSLRVRASRVLKTEATDATKLKASFSNALEKSLSLAERFENTEIGTDIASVLSHLLDLLSTPQFVTVVETLLGRPSSQLRRSALKTFTDRVTADPRTSTTSRAAVMSLMPKIALIIASASAPNELKADALSCIDTVTLKYGKYDVAAVAALADAVTGEGGLKSPDVGLRVLSLISLTSMTSCLGGRIIPFLPKTVPFALEQLEESTSAAHQSEMIHNAVLAFLDELVKVVPSFMVSYLTRILQLVYKSASSAEFEGEAALGIRTDLMKSVATTLDSKTVLSAILKTWPAALADETLDVDVVLVAVEDIIDGATKAGVQKMHASLLQFLLLAFDLRRSGMFGDEDVEHFEEHGMAVALKMVYKLNDTIFKPMFLRILEWAEELGKSDPEGRNKRLTVFWKFVNTLSENLKSLVTDYYSYVLPNAVEITSDPASATEAATLWSTVITALHTGFTTDERDFWQSPNHFDAIAPALLSTLNEHTSTLLTPAIVELAHAAQSEEHFKLINTRVLALMRSEEAAVRLAAVETLTALYAKLGEDWLPLLPESVPVIAELMEDDEEEVERAVQRLVVKVEEFLGHGELEAMLQ